MRINQTDINNALNVLRQGGIILYPTDTVWGVGCDSYNTEAVNKIFKIKQRDDHKALITLVSDLNMLERTVDYVPEIAYSLIEYSSRPLTIVYDKGINVSPKLMGQDCSLAVRLTHEPFSATLCRKLGHPLVSTSANISGCPTPATFNHIPEEIKKAVDYVCTSRQDEKYNPKPSTVMILHNNGVFKVIRK